jgi:hypothetical protein
MSLKELHERRRRNPARDACTAGLPDSAAAKVKELVDEEGNPELKLRVCKAAAARASSTASPSMRINEDDTR